MTVTYDVIITFEDRLTAGRVCSIVTDIDVSDEATHHKGDRRLPISFPHTLMENIHGHIAYTLSGIRTKEQRDAVLRFVRGYADELRRIDVRTVTVEERGAGIGVAE